MTNESQKRKGRPRAHIESLEIGESFAKQFGETLFRTKKLEVPGLGVFELRQYKPRKTLNNFAGKVIKIRSFHAVRFYPTGSLKKLCNQR